MANRYGRYSGDFEAKCRAIAEQIETNFTDGIKHVMDVVQETVIRVTPVLTGRARNSLRVTEGDTQIPEPEMVGPFDTTGEYRIIENRKVIQASKSPEPNFHLQSKLHYLPELNAGSSAQAPAGFIETASVIAITEARKIKVL